MSAPYRRNVVRHLEVHAAYFQRATALRFAIQAAGDAMYRIGDPREHAAHARRVITTDPLAWLNSTQLVVALRTSLYEEGEYEDDPVRQAPSCGGRRGRQYRNGLRPS
jgi:hypothetical protein